MKKSQMRQVFNLPPEFSISHDLIAGVTIGIITIPQAMAFALLAGLPPIYGLYGSFIPLIIYGFFASSNYLNIGPVSVISIFIFQTLSLYVTPFTSEYIQAVGILGIWVGLIQLLLGVFRLGKYVSLIPKSVITGFIQAAAVVIIVSQLSLAFGLKIPSELSFSSKIIYFINEFSEVHIATTILFIFSLILLFVVTSVKAQFPTSISLLIVTGLLAYFFEFEEKGIRLIGEIPQGLPVFILPTFDLESLKFLPGAFGIAFVASVGSLIMARSLEDKQPFPFLPNRELIALGMAKIFNAFFGSLIPAGSFNRSILTYKIGAQTQIAGLISAHMILFTLFFLTPIIYFLPEPVIASIIIFSVYFLFDFNAIKTYWNTDKMELFYLVSTMLITFIFGFVIGIFSGIAIKICIDFILSKFYFSYKA